MNKCYLLIQVLLRLLHAVDKVVLRKFIWVVHIFDETHVRRFALCECSAHEPGPLRCPWSCFEIHHLFDGPLFCPENESVDCAGSVWGCSCKSTFVKSISFDSFQQSERLIAYCGLLIRSNAQFVFAYCIISISKRPFGIWFSRMRSGNHCESLLFRLLLCLSPSPLLLLV